MKQFTRFSIGRPFAKLFALAVIVTLAFAFVGSIYEGVQAKQTAGTESIIHQENSDRLAVLVVAAFLIPAVAVQTMRSSVLGLTFSRTEDTLLEYLKSGKAEQATINKYLSGALRFRDRILYRSILIDGFSGIQKIWDSTISKAVGVTNVDRAKLDKDETVCVDTILIGYANSGGAGTDPSNIAGYDYVVTGWPAGLRNAELVILQDNNVVVEDIPVQACGSMADSMWGVGRAEGFKLVNPIILEGDKNFEVRINFPQAVAAVNTDFLRIDLMGVSTRKRGLL